MKSKKEKYMEEINKIYAEEFGKVYHHIGLCFQRFANRVFKLNADRDIK